MSERDLSLYIVDIFIAMEKIRRYVMPFSSGNELLSDELRWDGVIRELEIIGEATKPLLSEDFLDKEYRRIVNFRNQIIHGYFGIDEEIVYRVATGKIEEYYQTLLELVRDRKIDLTPAIERAREDFSSQTQVLKNLEELKEKLKG